MRVSFNTPLNYHEFPLEDHKLSLVLSNNFFTPYEVMFVVSNTAFVSDPGIFIPNWSVDRLITNYGYYESSLDQVDKSKKALKPVAVFIIEFVKTGLRRIFIVFVPIFIAFFLSLISFFLALSNMVGRATLTLSAISALLGYRFVLENIMPKVGYFTTTDHIYIILLSLAFLIFLFQTLVVKRDGVLVKKLGGNGTGVKRKTTLAKARDRLHIIDDLAFLIIVFLLLIFIGFVVIS